MTARYLIADVFDGLTSLETGSVDLVVTSPPFLALRSYLPADHPDKGKEIGSEATPAEWIDVMLRVTQELRRVLAPHGSICVELGDTYAGSGGAGGDYGEGGWRGEQSKFAGSALMHRKSKVLVDGKRLQQGNGWPLAKSRTLIPQLYEIALAYGINPLTGTPSPAGQWRIRNVVTWARPNPPVGALGDKWRPATSDLIVACVSPKRYWDDLATRRPFARDYEGEKRGAVKFEGRDNGNGYDPAQMGAELSMTHSGAPLLDYWEIPLLEGEEPKPYGPKPPKPDVGRNSHGGKEQTGEKSGNWNTFPDRAEHAGGSPLLDYWEIPPGGYKGSHYAVFPEELVVPCVKAMCPERVCRTCGEPSRRITETTYDANDPSAWGGRADWTGPRPDAESQRDNAGSVQAAGTGVNPGAQGMRFGRAAKISETVGWTDCGHDDYRPGLILDPFAGSGTTLSVATGHGHDAIGIDLDPRNADLARDRIGPFLFEQVTV